MWLNAEEALRRLGSKPQSLYASVSRGRIRAKPDPADSRRSLYLETDVDRLAKRARGRRSAEAVASEAVNWGDPVLPTTISTIERSRLYYRGVDAARLAETATLEEAAELLWGGRGDESSREVSVASDSDDSLFVALARLAERMRPSEGQGPAELRRGAELVLGVFARTLAGEGVEPVHFRLARRWRRPEAADAIRRALVLLADHELNASSFAARVAVSTGASLAAGALAGLATLSGPRHGSAARAVAALADDVGSAPEGVEAALRDWLGEGRHIPGFGHRLYPDGDVRAKALLAAFEVPEAYRELGWAAELVGGEAPNIDFALAALVTRFRLPDDAAFTLFALGRSVGWLAQMMEQAGSGAVLRPRARYVGVQAHR